MDSMSPQQRQDSLHTEDKRRMKSQSYRRQSAPSLVLTKALSRSKTMSRESLAQPVCPESCQLVQSFLVGTDRSFLLHGHAHLKTGMQTQDRHLFLFTDTLLIAKAKSANHFKQKAQACVCELWTAACVDEVCEGSVSPDRSFVIGWPTCNYVATFSSAEQKEKWLSLLKSRIKEEKEREEPKTIPLRVYGKEIDTFAVTKTLPVSNWDSTNEVLRLALQQFSIIGNVKDFQLWVMSKRDHAPYPLIGHEFPFSIHMSHVRHSMPADRHKAVHVEQLQGHKQCQFIMRPRPTETLPHCAECPQKHFKRRRSLITWAFWRGSASHLHDGLTGSAHGCLFSQPLSSVCLEDALPKPVMDMLTFLYHEGPWTRGIFRRPAGARAVRELREALDRGQLTLPLTRDHVFLIAGVFKDFLRSIPGSLLCCDLLEEWMDVLEEEEDEEERVQEIKRMICRVPKENALLLRYLLAMLHAIQGHAQENQMNTSNLAVCIAPSMLWPPGAPCSPEVEGEGAKKVCRLVKFMIEHSQQILGQDPSSLFGGPPQRQSEEPGSESWLYPLTDSSYDSLENELDNSSGGSPSFCSSRLLPPKLGSLDSIRTFSDCDQDTDPDTHDHRADSRNGQKLGGLGGTKGRRQDTQTVDAASSLDLLSLDGWHRTRRSSEPAIAYVARFGPYLTGNTGQEQGGDKELSKKPSSHTSEISNTNNRGYGGEPVLNLPAVKSTAWEQSFSSTSHAPTLDSTDPHTWVTSGGLHHPLGINSTTGSALTTGEPPDLRMCPKGSPPKEPVSWGTFKSCRGLHPNSWLRKSRRLSLTQQENSEREEEDQTGGGPTEKVLTHIPEKGKVGERGGGKQGKPRTSCSASKDERVGAHVRGGLGDPKQDSNSPPSHQRSAGSLPLPKPNWAQSSDSSQKLTKPRGAGEQPPPSLSLFKPNTPSEEQPRSARVYQRRGSEPGWQIVDRGSTGTRARLPSDPGLKLSEVESRGGTAEARYCLSPCASKVVREYFSSHLHSSPQSSQQVALSLVESHREWLKRCTDPRTEADFDQLLFADEYFV